VGTQGTQVLVDFESLTLVDAVDLTVPRGEPRRLVAELAQSLAAREPVAAVRPKLVAAAVALWNDELRARVQAAADAGVDVDASIEQNVLALAAAFSAATPVLARHPSITGQLAEAEALLAELDEDDRASRAPALARVAVPALGVDVELMKDEGYRDVATYPPEGSEGVDVVGRAATWLTKRMTVDDDGPRLAMRRFLARVAEEVEVELPVVAALIDAMLEAPMPEAPFTDRPFLSLARGLVEEAVDERGFPW
jgi:hypothetical protein